MRADVDRGGLSAAWGVVAVVLGGGAVATWLSAVSPGSRFPVWPGWTLSALTVAAIYMCFASLFATWPFGRDRSGGEREGPSSAMRGNAGQRMTASLGGIQAAAGARVKTGDVFIVNSQISAGREEVEELPKAPAG